MYIVFFFFLNTFQSRHRMFGLEIMFFINKFFQVDRSRKFYDMIFAQGYNMHGRHILGLF